jgi:ubiquinone/menaquinone biosynthesis C-methylase UbiE
MVSRTKSTKPLARGKVSPTEADSVLESLWDQDAIAWDKYWVPVFRLFARDLAADASPSPGDVILDIGTGTGAAAIEVCTAVPSVGLVVGIDRSEAMIQLARKNAVRAGLRNLRFHKMTAEQMYFPDGFFDVAISNCGIAVVDFSKGMNEVLRTLKPGGVLVFNDWHLIDVKPHQVFGEVLGRYRTKKPSPLLERERLALATMESIHHSLNSEAQSQMVHDVGFTQTRLTNRKYRIRLPDLNTFLKMRLSRLAVRREMWEMTPNQRKLFVSQLKQRLRVFWSESSFAFDWNVFYIRTKKPR